MAKRSRDDDSLSALWDEVKGSGGGKAARSGNRASNAKKAKASTTASAPKTQARTNKGLTEEDLKAAQAQKEALGEAKRLGMIEQERAPEDQVELLSIPRAFVKCSNREVKVKKSSRGARARYLFVFPGQLAVLNEGVAGTLNDVGTNNPTMDIEFDKKGTTLRLFGSLTRPANTYLVMDFHNKGNSVQCDTAYSNIVIFNKYQWINVNTGVKGPVEDAHTAPEIDWEDPPVLGNSLKSISLDEVDPVEYGASQSSQDSASTTSKRLRRTGSEVNTTQDSSDEESFHQSQESHTLSQRSSSRKRANVVSYDFMSGSDEEEPSDEDDAYSGADD